MTNFSFVQHIRNICISNGGKRLLFYIGILWQHWKWSIQSEEKDSLYFFNPTVCCSPKKNMTPLSDRSTHKNFALLSFYRDSIKLVSLPKIVATKINYEPE